MYATTVVHYFDTLSIITESHRYTSFLLVLTVVVLITYHALKQPSVCVIKPVINTPCNKVRLHKTTYTTSRSNVFSVTLTAGSLLNKSYNKRALFSRCLHTNNKSQYLYFYGKPNDLSGVRAPTESDLKSYTLFLFRVFDGSSISSSQPVVLDQGSIDKELSKGLLG